MRPPLKRNGERAGYLRESALRIRRRSVPTPGYAANGWCCARWQADFACKALLLWGAHFCDVFLYQKPNSDLLRLFCPSTSATTQPRTLLSLPRTAQCGHGTPGGSLNQQQAGQRWVKRMAGADLGRCAGGQQLTHQDYETQAAYYQHRQEEDEAWHSD